MTVSPAAEPLRLDHLTIMSRSFEHSAIFYDRLLPMLGFVKQKRGVWSNPHGLYLQFAEAREETRPYERYGPGLNHLGFNAPSGAHVEQIHAAMTSAGFEGRLQDFPGGTRALFLPDPDGLRVEISYYPPGTPPVD